MAKKEEEINYGGDEGTYAGSGGEATAGKKNKSAFKETAEAVVIAVVLALIIRTFIIQAFKIPSGSMEDTLLIGDHLIVSKFSYGIQLPKPAMVKVFGVTVPFFETRLVNVWGGVKHGDVVVFRYPVDRSKDFIKRAVALPGETIEVRDNVVYIDGKREDPCNFSEKMEASGIEEKSTVRFGRIAKLISGCEYFYKNDYGLGRPDFGPYVVPDAHVFVMGDHRDNSADSRYWGPVPIRDIKGKAFIIYWSWGKSE